MGLLNNKLSAIIINSDYLTEKEYNNLDICFSTDGFKNDYHFVASIYETGVILCSFHDFNEQNVKNDFPNLYKLFKMCKKENIDYIDIYESGYYLPVEVEKEYELKIQ